MFPDGQLYVNLRGFDPALPPMSATEATRLVLDALEVPAEGIPASLDAQAGLYRTVIAGKKVLILADNAAGADQPQHPHRAGRRRRLDSAAAWPLPAVAYGQDFCLIP